MVIKQSGNILREAKLNDNDLKVQTTPQLWQFKPLYDAAIYGFELIWPFEQLSIPSKLPEYCIKNSKNIFCVKFNDYVRTQEGYNLFIMPHHMSSPIALCQTVETDWWPNKLEVFFKYQKCIFKKDEPFAQAILVPRRSYVVKQMDKDEKNEMQIAETYLEENKDTYITRLIKHRNYATQHNLYERMIHLHRSNELPIKNQKNDTKIKKSLEVKC